jgi:hypothetical protein
MAPPFEEVAVAEGMTFDLVLNADGTPKWGEANSDYVDILLARYGFPIPGEDADVDDELESPA